MKQVKAQIDVTHPRLALSPSNYTLNAWTGALPVSINCNIQGHRFS